MPGLYCQFNYTSLRLVPGHAFVARVTVTVYALDARLRFCRLHTFTRDDTPVLPAVATGYFYTHAFPVLLFQLICYPRCPIAPTVLPALFLFCHRITVWFVTLPRTLPFATHGCVGYITHTTRCIATVGLVTFTFPFTAFTRLCLFTFTRCVYWTLPATLRALCVLVATFVVTLYVDCRFAVLRSGWLPFYRLRVYPPCHITADPRHTPRGYVPAFLFWTVLRTVPHGYYRFYLRASFPHYRLFRAVLPTPTGCSDYLVRYVFPQVFPTRTLPRCVTGCLFALLLVCLDRPPLQFVYIATFTDWLHSCSFTGSLPHLTAYVYAADSVTWLVYHAFTALFTFPDYTPLYTFTVGCYHAHGYVAVTALRFDVYTRLRLPRYYYTHGRTALHSYTRWTDAPLLYLRFALVAFAFSLTLVLFILIVVVVGLPITFPGRFPLRHSLRGSPLRFTVALTFYCYLYLNVGHFTPFVAHCDAHPVATPHLLPLQRYLHYVTRYPHAPCRTRVYLYAPLRRHFCRSRCWHSRFLLHYGYLTVTFVLVTHLHTLVLSQLRYVTFGWFDWTFLPARLLYIFLDFGSHGLLHGCYLLLVPVTVTVCIGHLVGHICGYILPRLLRYALHVLFTGYAHIHTTLHLLWFAFTHFTFPAPPVRCYLHYTPARTLRFIYICGCPVAVATTHGCWTLTLQPVCVYVTHGLRFTHCGYAFTLVVGCYAFTVDCVTHIYGFTTTTTLLLQRHYS